MMNYLYNIISREGKALKISRTIELRIIPLLKSKHFNFEQSGNLLFNQNYIFVNFSYPHSLDIDFKLRQLNRHIERYEMEGEFAKDEGSDRYVYRIYKDNEQVALFHIKKREKKYKGYMAIVLDDFGYNNNQTTRSFLAMDVPLNISIIPGHRYSQQIAESAVDNGHEVMIHMPMEPFDYTGGEEEYILRPGMSSHEVNNRVKKALDQIPQAIVMNNHMGSKATSDPDLMRSLAASLKNKDLLFLDSYTYSGSVVGDVFRAWGFSPLKRDIFLDNKANVQYIKGQFDKALKIAASKGFVIVIGHDRPATLEALQSMIHKIEASGIRLVRISNLEKYFRAAA